VPLDEAVADYVENVLRKLPDERTVIAGDDGFGIGYG
jgi:hypothetical protein